MITHLGTPNVLPSGNSPHPGLTHLNQSINNSTIHKAASLIAPSCYMPLTGTIPVEWKKIPFGCEWEPLVGMVSGE